LWFAADGGKLVGQALARTHGQQPGLADRSVGKIDDLAVLAAYRGRGIGRALLAAAMRYLWDRDCHMIELTVDAANADARRLYDGLGFLVTGQLHWYRLEL
jgi:ribosomal protein S18 acetylase RimI-like enzyme